MPRVAIPEGARVYTATVTYYNEDKTTMKEEKANVLDAFDNFTVISSKVVRDRDRER